MYELPLIKYFSINKGIDMQSFQARMLSIITVVLLTVIVVGCSQVADTSDTQKSKESSSTIPIPLNDSIRGSFNFTIHTNPSDSSIWSYQLESLMFPDDSIPRKHPVNGGTVIIGGRSLSPISKGGTDYIYREYIYPPQPSSGPTPGQSDSWGISGNSTYGLPSFGTNFYIPKAIRLITPQKSTTPTVSKSNGFQVTWNSDANNPSGKVTIFIKYSGLFSKEADSTLPNGDMYSYSYVTDNGSYFFPASLLTSLPVGGSIQISVYRENHLEYLTQGKKFILRATASSDDYFTLVQ